MREKPIYLDPFFLFIYFLVTGRKEARTQRERGTEKGAPRSILLKLNARQTAERQQIT